MTYTKQFKKQKKKEICASPPIASMFFVESSDQEENCYNSIKPIYISPEFFFCNP